MEIKRPLTFIYLIFCAILSACAVTPPHSHNSYMIGKGTGPISESDSKKLSYDAGVQAWIDWFESPEMAKKFKTDTPLKVLHFQLPVMPDIAIFDRITGLVKIRCIISQDGSVNNIRIIESPNDILSYASIYNTKQWRFSPPIRDGKPVSIEIEFENNFVLDKE